MTTVTLGLSWPSAQYTQGNIAVEDACAKIASAEIGDGGVGFGQRDQMVSVSDDDLTPLILGLYDSFKESAVRFEMIVIDVEAAFEEDVR